MSPAAQFPTSASSLAVESRAFPINLPDNGRSQVDLIKLKIPGAFASAKAPLTWREVRFGIDQELLDPLAAVELAQAQLGTQDTFHSALFELASLGPGEPVRHWVEQLAESEPQAKAGEMEAKWLYLVLDWFYQHRTDLEDPLLAVEQVYADFDYPECLSSFVRYMPMQGPDLGSRAANEARLFERWKSYLDECAGRLSPP